MSNFTTIPFRALPSVLEDNEVPLYDRHTMLSFIKQLDRAIVDDLMPPESVETLRDYLDADVVLYKGHPVFSLSSWLDGLSVYGSDLVLTPTLETFLPNSHSHTARAQFDMFHAVVLEYLEMVRADSDTQTYLNLPTFANNLSDHPATHMKVYGFDLNKGLDSLTSKSRNEIRRAKDAHSDKDYRILETLPTEIYKEQWGIWGGNEESDPFQLMLLWAWVDVCQRNGLGRIYEVYESESLQRCFMAGFCKVSENKLQFICYSQHPEKKANYSGVFTLASVLEHLLDRPMHGVDTLVLTCPLPTFEDHSYELYKRHLSNFLWDSPSLYYTEVDADTDDEDMPFPPYFNLLTKQWVAVTEDSDEQKN